MNYLIMSVLLCSCISLNALTHQKFQEQIQALAQKLGYQKPSAPAASEPTNNNTLTETELVLHKSIVTALMPLMMHYPADKLLSANKQDYTPEEQLEHTHIIATFLERLAKKCENLSPEARAFMKTKKFAQQSVGKSLVTTLIALNQLLQKQLETYKSIKSPSATIKELKKITTSASKNLEALLHDGLGL